MRQTGARIVADVFDTQLEFLRRKLDIPTEKWDDLWQEQHDRAFVAAKAMQADLLADLHGAVSRAIEEGQSIEDFRAGFDDLVTKHGWLADKSGEYRAWRARLIYETNLRTSYAAGRYAYLRANTDAMPYWRWNHSDASIHPRPHHVALDGLILPASDPFWSRSYPPCGFSCKCTVDGVNAAAIKAQHWEVGVAPADFEPDPGWAYAPGASVESELAAFLEQKTEALPSEIRQDLMSALADRVTDSPILASVWKLLGGR